MGISIGLEVHCQLTALKTKLFCGCLANYRGREANTLVCPVCLGLPGALPVLNKKAVEMAIMAALALNCEVSNSILFFRKNYSYPDLPKNFQISQYDRAGGRPLARNGFVSISVNGSEKVIRIRRVHLEEDPARLIYVGPMDLSPYTLVDYNRSGIALLEIVTEPDLSSPKEARLFLRKLRSILEHLEIFDGSLEGSMRCDANVSMNGGPRVEIKNITSFKEVERALQFEVIRQGEALKRGLTVERETRHWDEVRKMTIPSRAKEEEYEYRYFPEPDLVPVEIGEEQVNKLKGKMPMLPDERSRLFVEKYGLPKYDAEVLTAEKALADYFEACVKLYPNPKIVSNWLMGDFLRYVHELGLDTASVKVHPKHLARMLNLIDEGTISGKIAKSVLREMMMTGEDPQVIVERRGLARIHDRKLLERIVDNVFASNLKAVEDALINEKAMHFLIGKVMEATMGRGDPQVVNDLVRAKIRKFRQTQKL